MRTWTPGAAALLALVALAGPAAAADYMVPILLDPEGTGGAPVVEPAERPREQVVRVDGLASSPVAIGAALAMAAITTVAFFLLAGRVDRVRNGRAARRA